MLGLHRRCETCVIVPSAEFMQERAEDDQYRERHRIGAYSALHGNSNSNLKRMSAKDIFK